MLMEDRRFEALFSEGECHHAYLQDITRQNLDIMKSAGAAITDITDVLENNNAAGMYPGRCHPISSVPNNPAFS